MLPSEQDWYKYYVTARRIGQNLYDQKRIPRRRRGARARCDMGRGADAAVEWTRMPLETRAALDRNWRFYLLSK